MIVFLGSYSGGGGGSSDDDDSQDEGSTDNQTQTGIDDFGGDGEDDSSNGEGAAAGAAGAAGAAAAAGTASGAASGAGAGTEPPEGDPEECDEAEEDEESEDEEESEPESPEVEEPDLDEPDTEQEDDIDDTDEDVDEEDTDEEDEDDDEEEDETMVVVQEVDALSAMSWSVQPVMKRVKECYGEEIELFYKPAPVRDLSPEQEKQKWEKCSEKLSMPVDPSFWDDDPPESTELVNRAFEAAIQQYRGEDYIRTLWRRGVAAGRDINDREVLIDLASELGLDPDKFQKDMNETELKTSERGDLPFTLMEIQGKPVLKNGRVRYTDFETQFTFQGIDEQEPQDLQSFIEEHGPVATPEVMRVYGIECEEAVQRLKNLDGMSSFKIGSEDIWYISDQHT